jgi:glycosyltransferase involved in cell wall biosynthesis
MTAIKLSILVPTVPSRMDYFYPRLIKHLLEQTRHRNDVEIIGFFDNKRRTVGEKRNDLLDIANGEYLVFIDDDDRIHDKYVERILKALDETRDVDCLVFNSLTSINGGPPILCKYGIEFDYGYISADQWRGKPAHTMVYKSAIAKKHSFPVINHGEDVAWVVKACADIKKQVRIDETLYWYDANYTTTSETAGLSDAVIESNVKLLKNKT